MLSCCVALRLTPVSYLARLQSIYRGHVIRQNTAEKVTAVRQRLHELSANFDPRDTLENRTEEAVTILSTTAILGKIIPAIDTLGASLSAVLCQYAHPTVLHTSCSSES